MSDTSQGPGWWMASDGKWYPPELWTGPPNAGPAGPAGPAQGAPTSAPAQGPVAYPTYPTYAQPTPYPQATPYAQHPQYGAVRPVKTNGLAIASLICSIVGVFFIPLILGVVFGFVARSQIKNSNGAQRGEGLALAGIIIGFAWAALLIVGIVTGANTTNSGIAGPLGALG